MPKRKPASRQRSGSGRADADYQHPVPAPVEIVAVLERHGIPLPFGTLADELKVKGEKPRKALRRRLQRLVSAGRLLINRKSEYCLVDKINLVTGIVSAHADGFGFLVPTDNSADVFLPFNEMRSLLNGDRVAVRAGEPGKNGKRSGTLVEILERGKQFVVGEYHREHGVSYVIESGRIPHTFIVPAHHRNGAQPGEMVKVEITEYPTAHREGQGKVIRRIGSPSDPGMLTDIAIEQYELPTEWNAQALREADAHGERVSAADKRDRVDLRDIPLVTIDGEDARDFDDAVYSERSGDGWRLIVAIADVSHYIQPGCELDKEAFGRGTSVYFADRVVPMLPETISNGLCSLNPDVDRLCMVCDMHVTEQGKVTESKFYRGVMRSVARLTYNQVDQLHQESAGPKTKKDFKYKSQITNLYGVFRSLNRARLRRGALDLDLPEAVFKLDELGRIASIEQRLRNDAHRLIEECMIAANVEAARFLRKNRLATLFRVHEGPDPDRFEDLRLMLQTLGIPVPEQALKEPLHLNLALARLAERPDYSMLAVAVLRSLSQAVYQPTNLGHYGLGLSCYAHFTSPIRRYPDLLVHRGIGHVIDGNKPGDFRYDGAAMERAGRSCSMLERRAEEATRHVDARLKCAFMEQHLGEELPGVISGITQFGLFVTLRELHIDGLVHVSSIGHDYFHCEGGGTRMVGERTGTTYTLGQEVSVQVIRIDIERARIDFEFAPDSLPAQTGQARQRKQPSHGKASRTGRRRRS